MMNYSGITENKPERESSSKCPHDDIHRQPYIETYRGYRHSGEDFYFSMYTCQKCKKRWTDPCTTITDTTTWDKQLDPHVTKHFPREEY
ncbi:hypothetical protein AKO1_005011 [Acrasis kona]|uniref:Uncharacterized protein n=1 Tax=Acrasis kona TaxID=1008807 RepID=A0AAW2Z4M2_9EUKA